MPVQSPASTSARPFRVLVIGAGPAAVHMHLPILARLRDAGKLALSVVCDLQRDRALHARRQFGFLENCGDAFTALERTDIDAAYIFGNAQLHVACGLKALQCGKHLFVEKPVAPSYAEAVALAQTASGRNLTAVGGHNRRFFGSLAAVRAIAGKGRWRFAEAVFHKPEYSIPPPFGARTWLGANGIHALDALVFMMGELPEHLSALVGEATEAQPSAFSALMRWRDGAQGVFLCNNNAGLRREEYSFHGLGETYRATSTCLAVERNGTTVQTEFSDDCNGLMAEHEAFLDAIRTGTPAVHSIEAIAPSLYLAELIESGVSGSVQLPLAEVLPPPVIRPSPARAILIDRAAALQGALARLTPAYRLVTLDDLRDSADDRPDVEAAILGPGSAALTPEVLAKLPRLAIVGIVALSLSQYEPDSLLSRGITLVNATEAYAKGVGEFALALAILSRRRAFTSHSAMRTGGWGTVQRIAGLRGKVRRAAQTLRPAIQAAGLEQFFLGIWQSVRPLMSVPAARSTEPRELRHSTVGLIGWGANAAVFSNHLVRAQARVLVYSKHAIEREISDAGASRASLDEVLAADIVSLHRGLTQETRHFLGAAELAKLRPGAVLINVARGALIEPNALLARLRQGDVFACLDSFEHEPLPASHPLRKLPNVFLTSHIAGGSPDMRAAAAEEVIRKVDSFLSGEAIECVSTRRLATMT
jgi:phosphoglycerate dehydrogenase-like enzyme/predicted dehydrogenase